ncbi:unnamed protein product, partial [Adineta steineri]
KVKVKVTPLSSSSSSSNIEKSDVILIGFSEDYSKDSQCINDVNQAKSLGKILIPFVIRKNEWVSSITIATLFYDLFDREIDCEFIDDFDFEYDQLLSILLRYTKPGAIGRPFSLPRIKRKEEEEKEPKDYQEIIFGNKSVALQKIQPKEIERLQKIYQQELKKKIILNKIPTDEIDGLVASLTKVVDDLKKTLKGEDNQLHTQRTWIFDENCQGAIYEFMSCIRRWLKKAPNVTKKQFAPFTPTGDVNDAIFSIDQSVESEKYKKTYELFNCLITEDLIARSISDLGSSNNEEQANEYFMNWVRKTKPINEIETEIKEKEIVWHYKDPDQADEKMYIWK